MADGAAVGVVQVVVMQFTLARIFGTVTLFAVWFATLRFAVTDGAGHPAIVVLRVLLFMSVPILPIVALSVLFGRVEPRFELAFAFGALLFTLAFGFVLGALAFLASRG